MPIVLVGLLPSTREEQITLRDSGQSSFYGGIIIIIVNIIIIIIIIIID